MKVGENPVTYRVLVLRAPTQARIEPGYQDSLPQVLVIPGKCLHDPINTEERSHSRLNPVQHTVGALLVALHPGSAHSGLSSWLNGLPQEPFPAPGLKASGSPTQSPKLRLPSRAAEAADTALGPWSGRQPCHALERPGSAAGQREQPELVPVQSSFLQRH